jgi:hypothetical protein
MVKGNLLNLKAVPMELHLILELLKDTSRINLNEQYQNTVLNWDMFLSLAVHHRVYPLLYIRLRNSKYEFVPPHVIALLKNLYMKNAFQMLHLSAEMDHINQLCINNCIDVLFLKGPVLSQELYNDISNRTSVDIDLLIPINDLKHIENLLHECGYVKDDYIRTVLDDWKWRHHHITFFHPEKKVKIEVHWRLNPGPGREPSFQDLWYRKRQKRFSLTSINFLGEEDLFLFLVSHGARHGWSRIRWLDDIQKIILKNPDWEKIFRLLKKYGLVHIGGQAILLSSELLNTPINKGMKKFIKTKRTNTLAQSAVFYLERMVNLHTQPLSNDISKYHSRHLISLMSSEQKILTILSSLYPYYTDIETLPLPKKIHGLYFILRPFLCIWRIAKKQALP